MKAVISISATQGVVGGENNNIEFMTDGIYTEIPDGYAIKYKESEVTGLSGNSTTVEVTSSGISVTRRGWLNSRMDFAEGEKTRFLLDMQFGSATLGVDTKKISSDLHERGGAVSIDYTVSMDHSVVSKNRLELNVRPRS